MTKTEIKQNLHSLIDTVEDEGALAQIQEMLESITENPLALSSLSEQERISVNTGIEQLNNGEKIDYEDIKKNYPEWLRR